MMLRRIAVAILCAFALWGCAGSDQDEVVQWMAEQRNSTRPRVQPIPEPKTFAPQAYNQEASTDPFSNQKLTQALRRESAAASTNAGLIAPELARRKEPLESFPLDTMSMTGSLNRAGQIVALIMVDKLLYQVKAGNYLGQNYGLITKITETEIALREIVQDSAGEWIERAVTLQLQEGSK